MEDEYVLASVKEIPGLGVEDSESNKLMDWRALKLQMDKAVHEEGEARLSLEGMKR